MTLDFRVRALVLIAGYAAASVVAYSNRAWYLDTLLPAIGPVVDGLLPEGIERTELSITMPRDQTLIALGTTLTEPVEVRQMTVPAGENIGASTLGVYALHHAALVFAILVAWPARTLTGRIGLLALAPLAVLFATLLDIPFVLAGLIHDLLIESGAAGLASRNLAVYYEFVNRGGRLGLSIAAAVAVGLGIRAHEDQRGVARRPEL